MLGTGLRRSPTMNWKTASCHDSPEAWLGEADGIDPEGSGLRAQAMDMTRACVHPRERALVLFQHVAQMRFVVSDLDTRCVPSLLRHAREGDGFFKTTLLVHLLRLVDVPARMRWVQLESSLLTRGLWDFVRLSGQAFVYPLTEAFIDGRWICTDAYTMDAPLLAAAEAAVQACDLMLVIGTSGVVYPAAGLVLGVHQRGVRVVIINPEATDLDPVADEVLRERAAQCLPSLLED